MKHHVHVYLVKAMQEFDVEADTEEAANAKALAMSQTGTWTSPDCKKVALIPTVARRSGRPAEEQTVMLVLKGEDPKLHELWIKAVTESLQRVHEAMKPDLVVDMVRLAALVADAVVEEYMNRLVDEEDFMAQQAEEP